MRIIYNRWLPLKGFTAMMFFGVILARKEYKPISWRVVNHESIHREQVRDCYGYIPYYLIYLYQVIRYGYRNAPFEVEAYKNQDDEDYIENRSFRAWRD